MIKIKIKRLKLFHISKLLKSVLKEKNILTTSDTYSSLTIDIFHKESKLRFTSTNGDLFIQGSLLTEELYGLDDDFTFGLDGRMFYSIIKYYSSSENLYLIIDNNIINIHGEGREEKSNFSLVMKNPYFSEDRKLDLSSIEFSQMLTFSRESFCYAVDAMKTSPEKEGFHLSTNFILYKNDDGICNLYTTTGSYLVNYNFENIYYNLNSPIAIPRYLCIKISELLKEGDNDSSFDLCLSENNIYVKYLIKNIDEEEFVYIKSKITPGVSITDPKFVIKEKEVQFETPIEDFSDILSQLDIFDATSASLSVNKNLVETYCNSLGNSFRDELYVIPLNNYDSVSIKFNYKLLKPAISFLSSNEKGNDVRVEISQKDPKIILLTNEDRNIIFVLSGQYS